MPENLTRVDKIAADLVFPFSCHLWLIDLNAHWYQFDDENVRVKKIEAALE